MKADFVAAREKVPNWNSRCFCVFQPSLLAPRLLSVIRASSWPGAAQKTYIICLPDCDVMWLHSKKWKYESIMLDLSELILSGATGSIITGMFHPQSKKMTNFRCAAEEGPDIRHRVLILKIKLITLLLLLCFGFYDLQSIKKCEMKFCASLRGYEQQHKHIKLGRWALKFFICTPVSSRCTIYVTM